MGALGAGAAARAPPRPPPPQQPQPRSAPRPRRGPAPAASAAAAGGAAPLGGGGERMPDWERRVAGALRFGTNLFPVWVVLAAVAGFHHPPLFTWFRDSYTTGSLMAVMLAMGLTLTFQEMGSVFTRQPQLLLLGMALQYTVLPTIGWAISKWWGLTSSLAIGVALVSCMPGGTASNIVAYIAKGDMPLSVMMTTASTLMAVVTTPLLTSLLVAVSRLRLYTPFLATVIVVLIVGSMISTNVAVVAQSGFQIISAVFCLHSSGFALGYLISKAMGLSEQICRTNSIEVGMQSSALAAVLAKIHFPHDPVIVAPCVLSACTHATVGSLLAGYWSWQSSREEAAAAGGGAAGGGKAA
ncbi:sodium bile acid symporter family [Raphidocelis subcapitata]|uniref:Sodium bile acid symporter family n=1 Tax=Raphidocelis subcapitata TaxID=307507 RepID=A0A2V0P8C3_9CHLO|nr:sodium bile acid symporter family [Raphidocelis subcapitata]|eukprot:GBF96096.1 sodium bile acid symporter family [Raphidocelis subcapitata]